MAHAHGRLLTTRVVKVAVYHPYLATAVPIQERIDLAQKANRRGNARPRSAEPLTRGGGQTAKRHPALTAAWSAGANPIDPQRADLMGKDNIDVPRLSVRHRHEMATIGRARGKLTSPTPGVAIGAGPQEVPPMVSRLKTPVFRGIEVGRDGARDSFFPRFLDVWPNLVFEAVRPSM